MNEFINNKKYFIYILFFLIIIFIFYFFFFFKTDQQIIKKNSIENNFLNNVDKVALLEKNKEPKNDFNLLKRNWDIMDPQIQAEAVLIETIDSHQPIFYYHTYKTWPIASLTKLFTATVLLENLDLNGKIEIDKFALSAVGNNGNLKEGDVYNVLDLIKIMIISSSNDAAVAFEQYLGKDNLMKLINEKIKELNMSNTILYDASGLDDRNVSTVNDLNILMRYILMKHPEILNWSRLPSILVQTLNNNRTNNVLNINPLLIKDANFLGGKTGTTEKAKENLAAVFNIKDRRFIIVILGAYDRIKEIRNLINWVEKAYDLK